MAAGVTDGDEAGGTHPFPFMSGGKRGEDVEVHWERDGEGLRTLKEGATIVAREGRVSYEGL